jgi:hypothetical protein
MQGGRQARVKTLIEKSLSAPIWRAFCVFYLWGDNKMAEEKEQYLGRMLDAGSGGFIAFGVTI